MLRLSLTSDRKERLAQSTSNSVIPLSWAFVWPMNARPKALGHSEQRNGKRGKELVAAAAINLRTECETKVCSPEREREREVFELATTTLN